MPSLRLCGVSFAYAQPVLLRASATLSRGWTGIVGPNGAGKTTLLRLLHGDLQPDSGEILRDPPAPLVLLCPQRVDEVTPEIELFSADNHPTALRLRGRLHLHPPDLDRWPTLSPGERKRWQIGAALNAAPDLLLLDEPSNHLDGEARALLAGALARFDGTGVLVSHDRGLLDSLCAQTWRIEGGQITTFPGSYSAARAAWDAEAQASLEAHDALRAEQQKVERRIDQVRRDQQAAQRQTHASQRIKGPKDSDGRSMGRTNLAAWAATKQGRVVSTLHERQVRLAEAADNLHISRPLGAELFPRYTPAPRPRLLQLQVPALRVGERVLLRDLDLSVGRTDQIQLAGPNGSGKSSLLRALLAAADLPSDRLLFVPQEISPDEATRAVVEARALPGPERGRLGQLLAALGVDPVRLLASPQPSPGEARKLAIALGLARQVWLLVLDEPTNHLDLPSVERLEAALRRWPGALLLVDHDPAFAAACTKIRWTLRADGRLDA